MISFFSLPLYLSLPIWCLIGFGIGHIYFIALRRTTDLIVNSGHPLLGLPLTLGRFALLITGLYVAVLAGGFALLAALAGVLCAKVLMLRQMKFAKT